jgi:hypothetical protein
MNVEELTVNGKYKDHEGKAVIVNEINFTNERLVTCFVLETGHIRYYLPEQVKDWQKFKKD